MKKKKINRIRIFFECIIFLIVCVFQVGIILATKKLNEPSKERYDLAKYFNVYSNETAVILQNNRTKYKGIIENDKVYLSLDVVKAYCNNKFYWDKDNQTLLFTTPYDIISAYVNDTAYYVGTQKNDMGAQVVLVENDIVYILIDYVKQYSNIDYTTYTEPNRINIIWDWDESFCAVKLNSDVLVRRNAYEQSPIMENIDIDDVIYYVGDYSDEWCEVLTKDGVSGYIQTKYIDHKQDIKLTSDYEEVEYPSISKPYTICLGWHQVTNQTANGKIADVLEARPSLNTISPTWFSIIDNDGNISSLANKDYVNTAHSMGVEVWALVDDFSKEIDRQKVLSTTSSRQNLINNLILEVKAYNIDGINIDFEYINEDSIDDYLEFLRELSIECRKSKIVLSIDNYVPASFNLYYNRTEQGQIADYIMIMGYDEHYNGSNRSGSVASIDFVREGIEETLKEVPKEKIINGIPFYTRIWVETPAGISDGEGTLVEDDTNSTVGAYYITSSAASMEKAETLLADNGVYPEWDSDLAQYYGEYESDGSLIRIWLEEANSIKAKLDVIKDNDLAGVACWKLGLENDNVWEQIDLYLKQ